MVSFFLIIQIKSLVLIIFVLFIETVIGRKHIIVMMAIHDLVEYLFDLMKNVSLVSHIIFFCIYFCYTKSMKE